MEFRILGPLEVLERGVRLELGGAKQRALLAVLLLHRREAVSTDRLIDELWGERPPATAAKTIQVYVSRLRRALGDGLLETHGRAYLLAAAPEQVDVDRFESLVAEGPSALGAGEERRAAERLRSGLGLWRGPPLADFAYEPFAQSEIARLEEARLAALEDRIDAELALGSETALIGELEALVRDHPLRERMWAQLMLALYRASRQADALKRYQQARRALLDELGLEPGRALVELERAILVQDPALDVARFPAASTRSGRRMRLGGALISGGGLVLLGVAVGALLVSSGGGAGVHVSANSVAVIDAKTGRLLDDVPVGAQPVDVAAGDGAIWVANSADSSISQIDPASRRVLSTTAPGTSVDGLAIDANGLWLTDVRRSVAVRIDPSFRSVASTIRIAPSAPLFQAAGPVAVGAGAVWAGNGLASIIRIDPTTNAVRARIDVCNDPDAIAVGAGAVWVADGVDNTVTRIDPTSDAVTATIPVGQGPGGIAVGAGAVWVTETGDDSLARIDPSSGAVTATIAVGRRPTAVTVAGDGVWVANSLSGTLSRIDPATNRVVATVNVGQSPQSLTFADGRLWVSVAANPVSPTTARTRTGGVLRVLLTRDLGGGDPALFAGDYQLAYATCALLLNYPDRPFPQGDQLQPEVASAPPMVSDHGRTYTYTVRPRFRFSPPSDQPVTAAAFKRAIERALSPTMQSFAAGFMGDIVGAKAYIAGHANRLAGVSATGDKLVIHLTAPAPDLPARLAAPWFCAVPPDTPITPNGVPAIPSAGPYYVADYVPNRRIVLRRNPNYRGARPYRLTEIDYEIGVPPSRAVAEVLSGQADYYSNAVIGSGIPPASQAQLEARYGPASAAARAGHQQYFVVPQLAVYYLVFNTHRAPFNDLRLRQAVNYALNRRALATVAFPASTGRPSDQYIPPGMPGYRDAAIYPLGAPNLVEARRLAGHARRRAVLYVCNLAPCAQFAQIVHDDLAAIGITVEVHQLAIPQLFNTVTTPPGQPFDLAQYNYQVDFADPFDFINLQFQPDLSQSKLFADPTFDHRMREAAQLTGAQRYSAYEQLDHDLVAHAAPAAAYASGTTVALFSARIGCQLNQPIYGIDYGTLCVRP